MLLARSYSETGRIREAAQKFNEAVEMVEMDDRYLQSEKLRVKFDDERRELYDSAIEFEYKHGSPDAAWTYLQKYRAKLFLEFLGQFNPDIERIRGQALQVLFFALLIMTGSLSTYKTGSCIGSADKVNFVTNYYHC